MSVRAGITSRDNPLITRVRRLIADNAAHRRLDQVWLEGDHLLRAALARGITLDVVLVAQGRAHDPATADLQAAGRQVVRVDDGLWRDLSGLQSPPALGALISTPAQPALLADRPSVVLDRVQDAGNVGSILRSAAALGFLQVVALKGSAALWSSKVLRAGMGAHFGLRLFEAASVDSLSALRLPLLGTSSQASEVVGQVNLPWPCAWVFGHEGQGIDAALASRCARTLAIAQPGGEESLNVAAAAAICLYESARQRDAPQ